MFFGHNFTVYSRVFSKYFIVNCETRINGKYLVRIKDKVTNSCIMNVYLNSIISSSSHDILRTLYLEIFKYEDCFSLRHHHYEYNRYIIVYQTLSKYFNEIIKPRDKLELEIDNMGRHFALDHAHNLFYNSQPSSTMNVMLKQLSYNNCKWNRINDESLYRHKSTVFVI